MIRNIEEHKSSLRKCAKAAKTRDNPLNIHKIRKLGSRNFKLLYSTGNGEH